MSRNPALITLGLLMVTLPCLAQDNWPEFRGPAGNGHATARNLPIKWSEKENIVWKTAIHDKGWSSPVIWGKTIWMTTATEDGKQLFGVCVELDSGKVLHDIKVFDVEKPAFCHPFNSYASSTPVIEEGRVYLHFGSAGTACVETTSGKVLWTRRDLPCDHFRGAGSSPILYKDLLILSFDGFDFQYLAALDKTTGRTVWKTDKKIDYPNDDGDWKKAYSTPQVITVKGKPQLISPSAEATIAYDPLSGKEVWRVHHGGMNASARPLFGHGRVYLTSGHGTTLVAVRPDGSGNVTKTHIDWSINKGVPTRSSLLLLDDLLFMVSDKGVAASVEAKTGMQVQQLRLGGDFSASPIFADGRIYFAGQEGNTYVVKPGREMKLLATNRLDDGCMASPAVVDRAIFLRTKTHLYRIEKRGD
jgi:outer membrane protein assembly factor BamB